jgi:cell wall-associated NlpC family hydrolase
MDDPRLTPARPDLAAKHLEGKVAAARFVEGEEWEIADGIAPLRSQPFFNATLSTQALKGERVTVYDRDGEGWAWGQLKRDGYVGWLPDRALIKPTAAATHKVVVTSTFAFPGPSIKLVVGRLDRHEPDFVAVAERFLGTPYLWGGKSSLGTDCSGLVQVSLNAAGIECPRDSDMQQRSIGRVLDPAEAKRLQRGDLIFWKGHVAIVRDADTLVHANAHHMATAIENTHDAIARIKAAGSEITAIKRLT